MIRCPDSVPPERREVYGGEFSLGRDASNNWVIPDPRKHISKKHCSVIYTDGGWEIQDSSSNGTFLNQETEAIGKGGTRKLRHRDRIRFDEYEIDVLIDDDVRELAPAPARPTRQEEAWGDPPSQGGFAANPDPLGGDSVFSPIAPESSWNPGRGEQPGPSHGRETLGAGTDPFWEASVFPADFDARELMEGPTQPDNAPALQGAFRPVRSNPSEPVRPPMPPQPDPPDPWASDQKALLPENWNKSITGPGKRGVPASPPRPSPPQHRPAPERGGVERPTPPPPAEPGERQLHPATIAMPSQRRAADSGAKPAASRQPVDSGDRQGNLLAAFLRGLGFEGMSLPNPEWTLERIGAAARATVSGLRQILIARARIKDEFRINRTVIVPAGNNPLKFSLDDDDALRMLLGIDHRGSMKPDAAIAEAFSDLRLHELATISAMQKAVRKLLEQFAPEDFERQTPNGTLQLGAQRKAKAWDLFVQRHRSVSKALEDDFDSVFGKEFARAYEAVVKEAAMKQSASHGAPQ